MRIFSQRGRPTQDAQDPPLARSFTDSEVAGWAARSERQTSSAVDTESDEAENVVTTSQRLPGRRSASISVNSGSYLHNPHASLRYIDEVGDDDEEIVREAASFAVLPMGGTLGTEIIGPVTEEDKKIFKRNQKLRHRTIRSILGNERANLNPKQTGDEVPQYWTFTGKVYSAKRIKWTTYLAYLLFMICGNTFRIRIITTMLICTAILYGLPWLDKPLPLFVCLVALLGVFNGIATGAYFALVSVFPVKTPIFWSIGQRLSTAIILAIQFALGAEPLKKDDENLAYFLTCASVSLTGVIIFTILVHLTVTRYQLYARDHHIKEDYILYKAGYKPSVSKIALLKVIWPTVIAGFLILFTDVGVITSLTYMPSSSGNKHLPLILVYIAYFGDFAGRQLVLFPKRLIWNQPMELVAAIFRFLWVPASMFYIKTNYFVNDWFLFFFIGAFAVIGGYIRTLIFTIGPQAVTLDQRSEVSIILNVGVTMGTYAGIAFAFISGATYL